MGRRAAANDVRCSIAKEFKMTFDIEEVVNELFPKTLDKKKAEGKLEAKREVAINMLKKGAKVPFICKVTGLSEVEVAKLQ